MISNHPARLLISLDDCLRVRVFSVTAALHSKARSVADVPRRPVIAPFALPRPSRSDRSVAPRANSPAASRAPKQNRTWYAPPGRTTIPSTAVGRKSSDDDPTREMPLRLRAHARASRVSPHMSSTPRAALTTHAFLRAVAPSSRNQSQPFESFRPFAIEVGAHHGLMAAAVPRAPRVRGETETRGRGQLRQAAQVPRHPAERPYAKDAFSPPTARSRPEDLIKRFFLFFWFPSRGVVEPDDPRRGRLRLTSSPPPLKSQSWTAHAVTRDAARRAETSRTNRYALKQTNAPATSVTRGDEVVRLEHVKITIVRRIMNHASHPST